METGFEFGYTYINKGPVFMGMIEENKKYNKSQSTDDHTPNPEYTFPSIMTMTSKNYMGPGAPEALLGNVRKHSHVIKAKASWPLMRNIEANGAVDVRYIINAGFVAGETAVEAVYKLGVKWGYNN